MGSEATFHIQEDMDLMKRMERIIIETIYTSGLGKSGWRWER